MVQVFFTFCIGAMDKDNDEAIKGACPTGDMGAGSVDCLALHKRGLYAGGQVSTTATVHIQPFISLRKLILNS